MFRILLNLFTLIFSILHASDVDFYSKFKQHDYKVQFTRMELASYNKMIYQKMEIITFKYNRSHASANGTFQYKVDLDHEKTDIIIQGYKFLSNEYRTFPIHFLVNQLRAFDNNLGGLRSSVGKCGNITNLDFKKGITYRVCNLCIDESKLPPYLPNGDFKFELTFVNNKQNLSIQNAYIKIFRPIKIVK